VLTGAVYRVPARILGWLKPGGRLLAVRGESPVQQVVLLTQEAGGALRETGLLETDLPYLKHAEPPRRFEF
jgi:protein-L-isoaspartate(D-aspartate) O-methyltransferase